MVDRRQKSEMTVAKETRGKYFYDLSKCVFVGVVVGGILFLREEGITLVSIGYIMFGVFLTACLAMFGNNILKNK